MSRPTSRMPARRWIAVPAAAGLLAVLAVACSDPDPANAPEVVGLSLPDAITAVEELGLELEHSDGSGEGRAIMVRSNWEVETQTPAPGTDVAPGSSIDVTVLRPKDTEPEAEAEPVEAAEKSERKDVDESDWATNSDYVEDLLPALEEVELAVASWLDAIALHADDAATDLDLTLLTGDFREAVKVRREFFEGRTPPPDYAATQERVLESWGMLDQAGLEALEGRLRRDAEQVMRAAQTTQQAVGEMVRAREELGAP